MRTLRVLFILLAILAIACSARADDQLLSLDAGEPYRLVVVLRFSKTPLFSRFFIDRIRRQISDHLTSYFGPLVNVEVELYDALNGQAAGDAERKDDNDVGLAAVRAQLGDEDLENLVSVTLIENHVQPQVLILDFQRATAGYQIRFRRWDGRTQQLGPVRSTSISDRQLVGKDACLAICQGFSPVATVLFHEGRVELKFQGSKWQNELDQVLQLPCVMQVVRVEKRPDGSLVHSEIPNTVVVVDQGKNGIEYHAHTNLKNPWQTGSRVVRFEAIKISPVRGDFTLRIQDERTRDPLSNCIVYANDRGFSEITDADLLGAPDRNGYVVSKKPLNRLAFIKITQGHSDEFLLPLVITSESIEATVRIPRDRAAGMKAEFERRIHSLIRDLFFLRSFHTLGVDEINALKQDKRYEEALKRAEQLADDLHQLASPAQLLTLRLRKEAESLKIDVAKRFAGISASLDQIENDLRTVEAMKSSLSEVIKVNDQRARAKVAVDIGKAKEQSGDFDEAITNYEQSLQELPDQPKVLQRVERLKEAWKIKSPEQQKARKFVYEVWVDEDISRVEDVLPQAKAAIEALIKVNDYLTAQKFILTNSAKIEELVSIASQLEDSEQPEDRAELEKISRSIEQLGELSKQLQQIQSPDAQDGDATVPPSGTAAPAESESEQ
ncbi:MAG TPA: hypothetical protein VGG64_02175 [Pirellulales bacterium]